MKIDWKSVIAIVGLVWVLATVSSCGVNRYGVGEYADASKQEIKEKFVSERKSGNKGLKQAQAQAIGGAVPINYVNPADLARTDNYIVTTKTTILDALISGVTGNLYSQSTVHVISLDGESKSSVVTNTVVAPKFKKERKPSKTIVGVGTEQHFSPEANYEFQNSFFTSGGIELDLGNYLFIRPSIFLNYNDINVDFSEDDLWFRSNGHIVRPSIDGVFGKNIDNLQAFGGLNIATSFGSVNTEFNTRYSWEGSDYSWYGTSEIRENISFGRNALVSLPLGLSYNLSGIVIEGRVQIPVATIGRYDGDLDFTSVKLSINYKF